jgi:hypothetical protein
VFAIRNTEPIVCRGQLAAALAANAASVNCDNVLALSGHQVTVNAAGVVSVSNPFTVTGFSGDDNGACFFVWSAANTRFEFIDVECPA